VDKKEDPSLQLLIPAPQERLDSWLAEFYGRPVTINKRELLRHRDLSYVERLWLTESLPQSLIYKLVLPPWDIELDINQHILIPSVSSSPQLYLTAHHGPLTALFLEDLGSNSLLQAGNAELAGKLGELLARLHRAYIYRVDDILQTGILKSLTPIDYVDFTTTLAEHLRNWKLLSDKEHHNLLSVSKLLATRLAAEPISLVHGDFFAENIILHSNRLFVIDWSWFTFIGVPLLDLATITMPHKKNGDFIQFKKELIEAYCFESARDVNDVIKLLPFAQILSRIFLLHWLVERKSHGIEGTTVGPVNNLIPQVVKEICQSM
jgi:hypothetical protein